MTKIVTAIGGVAVLFAIRVLQIAYVEPRSEFWWSLEMIRWTVVLGLVIGLVVEVNRMARQLMDHRERLAKIEAEASWARIELDVGEVREYVEAV